MNFKNLFIISASTLLVFFTACRDKNGNFNIFSVQEDKAFGAQVSAEIDADPKMKILDSAQWKGVYKYVYGIRDSILKTGLLDHGSDFVWRIRVVKDDSVLNAFCTPGGYIYVYTALMKYLASEDEFAGVMAHEMAHADKRHSTEALTRQYGVQLLFDIVFGRDKGQLVRIAAGLKELQYSRQNESQADEASVLWLYNTAYDARGAAGFFQKMIDAGNAGAQPEFLSTHPNPTNRVQAILDKWQQLGGKVGQKFTQRYSNFKAMLP